MMIDENKNSYFHVANGWNIQSFMNKDGGVEYFKCTTKRPHFSALVVYNYLDGEVNVTFQQGVFNQKFKTASKEKDINILLDFITKDITSTLIHEAYELRKYMRALNIGGTNE
jgi:hypothetical protein